MDLLFRPRARSRRDSFVTRSPCQPLLMTVHYQYAPRAFRSGKRRRLGVIPRAVHGDYAQRSLGLFWVKGFRLRLPTRSTCRSNDCRMNLPVRTLLRTLLASLVFLTVASALADTTVTSQASSLGYTDYRGPNIVGGSHRDTTGYTHSDRNVNGKRARCFSTDTLGYTRTICRQGRKRKLPSLIRFISHPL